MNRNVLSRRGVAGIALAAAAAIALAGCGTDTPSNTPTSGAASGLATLSGEIKASGASFPSAFYQEVIAEAKTLAPNLKITYNSVGSGTGKKEFASGLNDFAGTDSLVKDTEVDKTKLPFFYIPTVAAPITVSYNLKGVDKLQLSADTIAKIFQRDIKTWNDPAIAADNPGVTLPATAITVAHRSDASGTTSNFTKYLVAASPAWKLGSGDTVPWPADTIGGPQNTGVATAIKQTDGTIGYVDLSDAKSSGLAFAAIKNKNGKYVLPSLEGTTAALAGAEVKEDLTYNPLNAAGDASYPIAAPTFILVKQKYDDPAKAKLVKEFIKYLLTDGSALAKEVDFAPLPDSLKAKALAQLDKIS
ncbi:phosphate ABC transporter substrate-binding protein PstS [Catelliglobosispora koreensis]|uniref:phosphate ABC transporter substrate-binding protein PstS n=1 Tax=Catelliglobosispora koreensis TaxID=129052 RepID=UPI00036D137A|nr:phosphate ABC transporter substrate-binding protein PstS [Catelliglobosispora koreensis]